MVIAIIVILAAMLLPALSKAREKARSISCVNNLNAIMKVSMIYADDYDGYGPAHYLKDGTKELVWNTMLSENQYLAPKSKSIRCPSLVSEAHRPDSWGTEDVHYFYNSYGMRLDVSWNFNYVKGIKWHSAQDFPTPSDTPVYADSVNKNNFQVQSSYIQGNKYGHQMDLRHQSKTNMVFLDGHAGSANQYELHNKYLYHSCALNGKIIDL